MPVETRGRYIILPAKQHMLDDGYFVPSIGHSHVYEYPDLLVPMDKDYYGANWKQAHESLSRNNELMLTPRQFFDFIELLKSGTAYDGEGGKLDQESTDEVLGKIFNSGKDFEGEWLDAEFSIDRVNIYDTSQDRLRMACQHEIYAIIRKKSRARNFFQDTFNFRQIFFYRLDKLPCFFQHKKESEWQDCILPLLLSPHL